MALAMREAFGMGAGRGVSWGKPDSIGATSALETLQAAQTQGLRGLMWMAVFTCPRSPPHDALRYLKLAVIVTASSEC